MKEIGEAKSLRWLANQFPYTEGATDEVDKMSNCINVYCTNGADAIDELARKVEELQEINNKLLEQNKKLQETNDGYIMQMMKNI